MRSGGGEEKGAAPPVSSEEMHVKKREGVRYQLESRGKTTERENTGRIVLRGV